MMSFAVDETLGLVAALLSVKAVPGARRDEVAGLLGDRLKVRVSQPPEDGKANAAICALLARELGVKRAAVSVVRGVASPEKVIRVQGVSAEMVRSRWG